MGAALLAVVAFQTEPRITQFVECSISKMTERWREANVEVEPASEESPDAFEDPTS